MTLAERQLAHRHKLESRVIDGKLRAERTAQGLGFALVLAALIVGGTLIAFDKDASGLTAILGALASVVIIFVYGRQKEAEERRQKRADFAAPRARLPHEGSTSERERERPTPSSTHPTGGK